MNYNQWASSIAKGIVGGTGPVGAAVAGTVGNYDGLGRKEKGIVDDFTGGIFGNASDAFKGVGPLMNDAGKLATPSVYTPGTYNVDTSPWATKDQQNDLAAKYDAMAAGAAGRQGPQIATDGTFRTGQQDLINALTASANGQGPSVADMQMQKGTDDALKSAMALAASGRSGTAGGRLKAALDSASLAQQENARNASMLKVQEQLASRDMLGRLLGQGRDQDIGLATSQATADINQTGLNDALAKAYSGMGYGAFREGVNDQQGLQSLLLAKFLEEEKLKQQGVASENDAKAKTIQGLSGLASGIGSSMGGLIGLVSDRNLKTNITEADGSVKDFLTKFGDSIGVKNEPNFSEMPDHDRMKEFMSRVQSYEYDYKDPDYMPGRQTGPMAQDLEKHPIGASLVVDTPKGKMVDWSRGGNVLMAGLATLSKENDELRGLVESVIKKRGAA